MENLKNYIDSLELPAAEVSSRKEALASSASVAAKIDGGSIIGFAENASVQFQEDILYSTLLAQLTSDRRYDKFRSPEDWIGYYVDVMGKIGWSVHEKSSSAYDTGEPTFRMDKVSIGLIEGGAPADAVASLRSASEILANDWRSRAGNIFQEGGSRGDSGNFQVIAAGSDHSLSFGFFYFTSHDTQDNFFTADWKTKNTRLSYRLFELRLDESYYSRVRDAVIAKLAGQIDRYKATI